MALNRQGGSGIGLPNRYPVAVPNNSLIQSVNVGAGPVTLAAGEAQLIPPGQFHVVPGPYSFIQVKDPISGNWRGLAQAPNVGRTIHSDGFNTRLVNLSGCAAGVFMTNVGSGYTSAPTVAASAGSSAYTAVVGGAVNTTVTVSAGGSGYTKPPRVVISAPPVGGVQATAHATVSAGAVASVVVINQGAGYTVAPTVTFIPDPRDATATGATATTTLTGSGTITAVVCTDHGTPLTAVPTLSFTGGGGASAAATAVMCFTATGFTVGGGGTVYGNAQPFLVMAAGGIVGGTAAAVVNPQLDRSVLLPRPGIITGTSTAGGLVTATGAVVADGGLFQAVPAGIVIPGGNAVPTAMATVTITVGGVADTSFLYPV